MNLHVCVCVRALIFSAEGHQKYRQEKEKDGLKVWCFCVIVRFTCLPSDAALGCNATGRQNRESNRVEERERERGDTGERENQPPLTQRQSISSLLSLFPMGWPG